MAAPNRYELRGLYGGAITAKLPSDYIDASDLREIPDHQEVFLSKTTLTSIIFEINEYQLPSAVERHANIRQSKTAQSDDEAASTHHFVDPIAPPDELDPNSPKTTPERITLRHASLSKYPAYKQIGTIISPELDRTSKSILPPDWQQAPPQHTTETRCHQLLVRLEDYETDFCVRINVPLKEYNGAAEGHRAEEEQFADQTFQQLVNSLSVEDFGLFATE